MPSLSRRAFVGALAAVIPSATFIRSAHAAAVDDIAVDTRTMLALGEAVLPSALGGPEIAKFVTRFQRWIAGYREGAELVHGYGTSMLERTGPTPATRWAKQLDALEAEARKQYGKAFALLTVAERRTLVQTDLDAIKAARIPAVVQAPHVALALLAHFYGSREANDLCYDAVIGRESCRPLATTSRKPLPLAEKAGA